MTENHDPQRRVKWLNQFFRRIVGPAQVDGTRPGGYFEDANRSTEQLEALGLEMRTDAAGHSYVVRRESPGE
ncbi:MULTISPECIES: hypothetical protein [Brevibacterium]|uniref:Uncharacterized protein n=3 Tax=Brevibacterium casei TaxID=33889 RepID=K9AKH7_9MICO|nr:hypothetical protein [Brevibacterium casei]NJE68191.1 hypothetical protein [Brevibacterium sp. LS14]SIJ27278.1 Uncharacterised protein [Mycobacteroides abscessus subsp. abscessus]EKU47833.1 hypothetical protein C272_06350 [Brevibacterium casei S18]KZE19047.1 hypothetical protein AVW13_12255 [Brevibacterium casei]MBE4694052.1 hypothetical protein [Brevibacterium casei]